MLTSRWFRWVTVFAFWTVLGLIFSVQGYMIVSRFHNPDATFGEAIINTLPNAYVWALLVPIIGRLARRFRLEHRSWWRVVLVHIFFGPFIAALHTLLAVSVFALLWWAIGQHVKWWPWVQDNWVLFLHWNVVVYAAVVAIVHAIEYHRDSLDRERRALQLEARLAEAQLQALKMQLHPHFLFNVLNAIAELIHEDSIAAERMTLRLGDLLRATLRRPEAHEIPLEQELEFTRTYLEIEQMRFSDRLAIEWRIDPAAARALVPSLLLQPLVENALRHGIAPNAGAGRLAIRAEVQTKVLRLEVSDDGRGIRCAPDGHSSGGLGLSNTRERLKQLYGDLAQLELADAPDGGAVATVLVPFRLSDDRVSEAKG